MELSPLTPKKHYLHYWRIFNDCHHLPPQPKIGKHQIHQEDQVPQRTLTPQKMEAKKILGAPMLHFELT